MENRKRPFDAVSTSNDGFSTPEKRVSVVCRLQDSSKWGVDETCQYLQNEGLGQWQKAFRGQCSVADMRLFLIRSVRFLISVTQHKRSLGSGCGPSRMLTWRKLASSKSCRVETTLSYWSHSSTYTFFFFLIFSRSPDERFRILQSFRKLWQVSAEPHKVSVFYRSASLSRLRRLETHRWNSKNKLEMVVFVGLCFLLSTKTISTKAD